LRGRVEEHRRDIVSDSRSPLGTWGRLIMSSIDVSPRYYESFRSLCSYLSLCTAIYAHPGVLGCVLSTMRVFPVTYPMRFLSRASSLVLARSKGTGPFVIALVQDPSKAMDTFEFLPSPQGSIDIFHVRPGSVEKNVSERGRNRQQ